MAHFSWEGFRQPVYICNAISASRVGTFLFNNYRTSLSNLKLLRFGYTSLNLTNGHCVLTGSKYPYYRIRGHCVSFPLNCRKELTTRKFKVVGESGYPWSDLFPTLITGPLGA